MLLPHTTMAAKSKKTPYGAFSMGMFSPDKSFSDSVEERIRQAEQAGPPRSAMNSSPRRPSLPQEQINAFEEGTGMPFTNVPKARVVRGEELDQALEEEGMPAENPAELLKNKQLTRGQAKAFDEGAMATLAAAPRAKVVSPTEDAQLMNVYKTTMGSDFDPNSKADKRKLDELRSFMASKPDLQGMSANKIALAFYRRK